jgi:hypothetical protein
MGTTVRRPAGHWMTAVAGDPHPGVHFVPIDAVRLPYVYGASYIAPACKAQCVPASQQYLSHLRVCDQCRDEHPNPSICCTSESCAPTPPRARASSVPAAPSAVAAAERPDPSGGRATTSAGTGGIAQAPVPAEGPQAGARPPVP